MATTMRAPLARGQLAELTRLAPGGPALLLGARIGLATVLPLTLAPWIGPVAATWASTGAYSIALTDKGGSYRTRAATMGAATLGATLAMGAGGLASHHAVASIVLMAVWSGLCAFAGVLGPAAASVGTTTAVLFAIALAWPPASQAVLLTRIVSIFAAGVWTMTLALFFWPVRVYKPARFAVGRVLRELARHTRAWPLLAREVGSAEWIETTARNQATIRDGIETARAVLVATRRGRRGESGRGERLLALVQIVDSTFSAEVQLGELYESMVAVGAPEPVRQAIERALAMTAPVLDELAGRVETEGRVAAPPELKLVTPALAALEPDAGAARLHLRQATLLLGRIEAELRVAHELAATLYDDKPTASEPAPAQRGDIAPSLGGIIRDNLTPDSVLFRHAIRVAVTATAAQAVARVLQLERGYWVTITVLILLQPYTPATVTKTLQRVVGTVLGAIAAALVMHLVPGHATLMAIATVLAAVSAAVLQLNYTLYSFFMTPTFVLLAEAGAKDPRLPELRILNTLIGGLLAFLGARLLWPHVERRRFHEELASGLQALGEYLATVTAAIATRAPLPSPPLREARRRFDLVMNRADASFQRLLAESGARTQPLEPAMTALLFARRASATISAAGSARQLLPTPATDRDATGDITQLGTLMSDTIADLTTAVRAMRPPAPLPAIVPQAQQLGVPVLAARFQRLAEQLTILHHAVERWLSPRPPR
jgi:uncharacterized membrane protein YccC